MNFLLYALHFVWLAALSGMFSYGWGMLIIRRLGLPYVMTLSLGFAVFAAGAYAVFYTYLIAPWVGGLCSLIWGVVCLGVYVGQCRRADGRAFLKQHDAWLPGLLLFLLTATYLMLLYAGDAPASRRFTWDLPIDNQIPRIFADRLSAGLSPTPLVGDWLSSDRPPLQAGIALVMRRWHLYGDSSLNYSFTATMLQVLWVPGLFAIGRVWGFGGRKIAFALLCCASSGFFLVNSIYVWPKLLAAALTLTAFALVGIRDRPVRTAHAALAGGCAALGLLAHGGVVFSLLAVAALPDAWRLLFKVRWRGLAAAVVTLLVLYLPWAAYQRFYDPPGNRLMKWHLAGQIDIDNRGFKQTFLDNFKARGEGGTLHAIRANLDAVFAYPHAQWPLQNTSAYLRKAQFFGHVPALGVLMFGLFPLLGPLIKLRGPPLAFTCGLLVHLGVALGIWICVMFIPGSTWLHQGSYGITALLFFLCALGIAYLPGWLRWSIFVFHMAYFVWIWIATTPGWNIPYLQGILLSLCGCFAVLFVDALRRITDAADVEH